jgi:hypothetical protein
MGAIPGYSRYSTGKTPAWIHYGSPGAPNLYPGGAALELLAIEALRLAQVVLDALDGTGPRQSYAKSCVPEPVPHSTENSEEPTPCAFLVGQDGIPLHNRRVA